MEASFYEDHFTTKATWSTIFFIEAGRRRMGK
jgi:hypothetical protein